MDQSLCQQVLRDWSKTHRTAGWRADLAYFVDLVERRHPDPFHSVEEKEWRSAVQQLRMRIPRLTDIETIGEFMRLAAMIGDGHTAVYPPFEGDRAFHLLPIRPYRFSDGWRILAASPERKDLVGARILAIEGVPIADAAARISAYLPRDNERTQLWLSAVGMQFSEMGLVALNARDPHSTLIEVEGANGSRTVRFEGGPIDRHPDPAWIPPGWAGVEAPEPPLWLSRTDNPHWVTDIPELGAVYAQVNQIADGESETFADFAQALGRHIEETKARRLIVDLRHNNGGNGYLNWSLVREIVRSRLADREEGLFVIVGRRTFSAAMNLASELETRADAIFVGEPTGSRPNFYGEDTDFKLPYSGLQGSISSRWFQGGLTSNDLRPWIAPDLLAELTFEDVRRGRDPSLEAIAAFLAGADR